MKIEASIRHVFCFLFFLFSSGISVAALAADVKPCPADQYPGLTFGSGVPNYAVVLTQGSEGEGCYCGAWSNVTPSQARQQGWYASCDQGKGICNYSPGTIASNKVCGPFAKQ